MKIKNIILTMVLAFVLLFGGCQTTNPAKLDVPSVAISDTGLASWVQVANASSYKYKIDDGTETETANLSVQLSNGQKISVKAVGDGVDFSDSAYSEAKTYTGPAGPNQLTVPSISISNSGLASWAEVANASSYKYKIDDGTETETANLSVQLANGQKISVKAVGDGTNYSDSAYSVAKTYNGPTGVNQLAVPTVTINTATGLASWTEVANASSYKYKINDGSETDTANLSVQLADGQKISVKAVGDGVNYSDSDYSEPKTYEAGILSKFSTKDLNGNTVDQSVLSAYKISMINIWGTFCGPCINEMPDLGLIAGEYKSKGFQIIGVVCDVLDENGSPDQNMIAKAKGIVAQTHASYLHLLPSADMTKLMTLTTVVPTTIFVDSNGVQVGNVYTGSRSKASWKMLINQILDSLPKA